MNKQLGFHTKLVHAGYTPDGDTHSMAVPMYMSTAYTFEDTEYARKVFALEEAGNIYTRLSNPTCDVLERRLAALEGGVGAVSASSGHGAMVMTFLNLAGAGDEIVSSKAIYGGAYNMMSKTLGQMGIAVRFVDSEDPENFARATNDRTKAYFVESIGNPMADLPDIGEIARLAHANGVPLIVDNTIATPYLLRPFEHGADIVVHSTTKFLSGNGTVMGGAVVDSGRFPFLGNPRFPAFNTPDASYHGLVYAEALGNLAFITKLRAHILRDMGACQSPFNAWVTLLGMETLGLRMARHCENGLKTAEFLNAHPAVEHVNYPLLPESPYKKMAETYFPLGVSSVFSFDLKGGRELAARFCDSLELLSIVANLGDARTIVNCPALTTHSQVSDEELRAIGVSPGTIRISVGLEDFEDIEADLRQALARLL